MTTRIPPAGETLVDMLRQVSAYPGMTLRLYGVAGSPSGPHWQGSITWDSPAGQIGQGGFKIACRSDPIDALMDCVRQAIMYPTTPPAAADEDDILGGPETGLPPGADPDEWDTSGAPADDEDILG